MKTFEEFVAELPDPDHKRRTRLWFERLSKEDQNIVTATLGLAYICGRESMVNELDKKLKEQTSPTAFIKRWVKLLAK